MITVEKFLECVKANAERVTHYESGGDGSGGGCDCIGLIIGALRMDGEAWTGTHGSNWAARYALQSVVPLDVTPGTLSPGEVVFKAKAPGESGYDLPSRYDGSESALDYYHVGVVIRAEPLLIIHVSKMGGDDKGGVYYDTELGNWKYYGALRQVKYPWNQDETIIGHAVVTAESGTTVNLRKNPSLNADILERVSLGIVVDVLERGGTWCKVRHVLFTGYMMTKYLRFCDEPEEQPDEQPTSDEPQNEHTDILHAAYESAKRTVDLLKSLLGDDAK